MDHLVYLDHAATTAARPEVVEAMLPYFTEKYGNPSSIYSLGSETKAAITHAREIMAKSIGTTSENIYFTAGGSESDNWALVATAEAYASKGKHIITRMGLEGLEHRSIGQLSGGQLQRALLGRAIISDPSVLILDEPSTYIDKRFEARLYELLAEINKECAIILVSHDIGTVLQQVKSIACVNETLDYHPDTGVSTEWLERNFNCPIELLGHGTLPHRVLGEHHHHH